MKEEWKPIIGYEELYEVSNLGNVRSLTHKVECTNHKLRTVIGRVLKHSKISNGYYYAVNLSKDNKIKQFMVHRLVAEAFILNPDNKPCIDHIDGNSHNNNVSNLRWCTHKENSNNPICLQRMSKNIKGKTLGAKHVKAKGIVQYSLNNQKLKEWDCISDAMRETGISQSGIVLCAQGKINTFKGYKWSYK